MDMCYSAPIHMDPLLMIGIVDDYWAAEILPFEDIPLSRDDVLAIRELDSDSSSNYDKKDEDVWNDLSLELLIGQLSL